MAGDAVEDRPAHVYGAAQLLLVPWFAFGLGILAGPTAASWIIVLPLPTGHLAVWIHQAAPAASWPVSLPGSPDAPQKEEAP